MEIIVSVDNRNVPNFVQAEGQAKFKVASGIVGHGYY